MIPFFGPRKDPNVSLASDRALQSPLIPLPPPCGLHRLSRYPPTTNVNMGSCCLTLPLGGGGCCRRSSAIGYLIMMENM